jgi:carbonic anhydrase/acetyltransferase-like protein (isoleucine patch superfamily)
VQRLINAVLAAGMLASLAFGVLAWRGKSEVETRLRANVPASFNPTTEEPRIGAGTYIDPLASVIGDVRFGRQDMVAPFASVRGDEGQPIRIGSRTNIQDGVVIHALETVENGEPVEKNLIEFNDKKYAVYIGDEVSLAHQSQVHGPALVGDRTFVGMQALVFKSEIGEGSVIEPGAKVIGVKVAAGHYVPAGAVITTQAEADALPEITDSYAYRTLNDGVIHVNTQLADGYLGNGRTEPDDAPRKKPVAQATETATPARATAEAGATRTPTVTPTHTASPTPSATVGRAFPTLSPSPAGGH